MKHLTYAELNRRIAINFDLRNAEHQAMMDGVNPRISPLSPEWAEHAARYDALAAESDQLYAALRHMEGIEPAPVCRTCGFIHPETDCPRWPANV